MSTPPPQVNVSELPIERYHALSDATMDTMLDNLENLLDDLGKSEFEVEYSSGVLTLILGEHGTYVINKQPPNKQIWLSSPFSGPKRYDYDAEKDNWYYARDGRALGDLLNEELSKALDQKVDLGLSNVSSL
ncbi:Frataxin [Schizophyllum commune Tattone D]|nr:Frataxin [Schizophyllum commune Tattone D]